VPIGSPIDTFHRASGAKNVRTHGANCVLHASDRKGGDFALTSRYAIALYEMIELRRNLDRCIAVFAVDMPIDPVTGRRISPLTAAALCTKPRPLLTAAQTRKVDKGSSSDFAAMRHLAIPRPTSRWPQGKTEALAQRRAAFRDLCNAAVRP
jgi:hypothetical protein